MSYRGWQRANGKKRSIQEQAEDAIAFMREQRGIRVAQIAVRGEEDARSINIPGVLVVVAPWVNDGVFMLSDESPAILEMHKERQAE